MRTYSLSHVRDHGLLRGLATLVARDRITTARLLAHIAEFDARRLYLPAAYPSTYAYCVHALRLSEAAAYKRIQAARVARRFPVLFEAVADGRLHVSAVGLLAPHLTPANADELVAAAGHRTKSEVEELIAKRFPRPETLALVTAVPASPPQPDDLVAPGQVEALGPVRFTALADQLARGKWARARSWRRWRPNGSCSSSRSDGAPTRSCVTPRSCSATSSPRATSRRCSTVRWRR